jgi:ferredoxin/flavodoxin---NADP+ reductase
MALYKVAIVGAGPSGYFAAQALQNLSSQERTYAIDMFERLPTPWGLVRSGVAPDHPKIKTVSKVFEKIATNENFRLFGNVELGTDISLEQLQERYDAVILATGSAKGKKLGIKGEELTNSLSSADFVPWYNAHPDFVAINPDLSCQTAVVIGAGNVAMDVARMLALDPTELDPTDTADHAIASLKESSIRNVFICARRGAEFAAFTSPELRELPKLEHTNVKISKDDIQGALSRVGETIEKETKSNLDAMSLIADNSEFSHQRTMEFVFQYTPKEIVGNGKVEAVIFDTPKGEVKIPCGLVITAIGYVAQGLAGVPFESGKVANTSGKVADNLYVVGWAKRGPSGVIGTNKSDAAGVIELLTSQLGQPKNAPDIKELLAGKKIIEQSHWEKINAAEIAAGEPHGKPRRKVVEIKAMLDIAHN